MLLLLFDLMWGWEKGLKLSGRLWEQGEGGVTIQHVTRPREALPLFLGNDSVSGLQQGCPNASPQDDIVVERGREPDTLFIVHDPEGANVVLAPGQQEGAADAKGLSFVVISILPLRSRSSLTRIRKHEQRRTMQFAHFFRCQHAFV